MINFRRLSKYFLAYVILLSISAAIAVGGVLRPIDIKVYKKFYLESQIDKCNDQIKDKIVFVNIPDLNTDGKHLGVQYLRGQVAQLLDTIGSMVEPKKEPIVIIDITFSHSPVMLDTIGDAIFRLSDNQVYVYAAYDLPSETDNISFILHDNLQAKDLYEYFFTGGRLNTSFDNYKQANGFASYDSFELIDVKPIVSLPVKVVNDLNVHKKKEIDTTVSIQYPLPLKLPFDPASIKENSFVFTNDTLLTGIQKFSKLNPSIDLSNKFVIIGFPSDNPNVGEYKVPGPYLVASALVDQLNGNEFTKPPHDNIAVQLAMMLVFALFVCLIFAVLYKYVKKLQTKPHFISVLSLVIGLLLLFGYGYSFLEHTIIRPALPTLSMVWASVLAWHFTKKFLVTGIMEGGEVYDVFISYSHGDSSWVKQNLFMPLNEFKRPDGSKLSIFFDEKSIGVGELFTTKYMRSIVDSKLFVPVMSEEYYRKNHCKNEMDLAVKRHVEKLIGLCIIALDYKYVPEEFTHINYVDIKNQTDFMTTLKKELVQEEQKHLDESDTIEHVESDHQEPEQLEKKVKEKTKKKDKKEEKKKSKKRSDKKKKKEKKKKSKKGSNKKNKKEKKKKAKKRSDKKDKKERKKKTKKRSNKKDKKERKKKSKKS